MSKYAKRSGSRSKLEAKFVQGGMKGMFAWMINAAQRARDYAPVLTGRLYREIKEDPMGPKEIEPLMFAGIVGVSGLEYARAHELGSGIHSLDPSARELILIEAGFWTGKSDKKALSFFWPGGPKPHPALQTEGEHAGKYVFSRIYHPGVKPAWGGRGYLRRGARESRPDGRQLMILAITAALRS